MEAAVDEIRNSETVNGRVDDQDDHSDDHDNRIDDHADHDDRADDDRADDHDNQADDHDDRVKDHDDRADDHNDRTDDHDEHDERTDEHDDQADHHDDLADDTEIEKCSKREIASTDDPSSQTSTNVVTHQPKSSTKIPSIKHPTDQNMAPSTVVINDIDVDVEGGFDLDAELAFEPGTCLSASAGVGSASKDLCDGFTNLECRYPNVGCELSCGCDDGLELVSDCTMELCSANCILGCLAFSLGLALDTKAIWNQDGVEFEVLGTGIETSQGTVIRVFGSGVGIVDDEKRETMVKKRKVKEARRARKKAVKEQEKIIEKATELEVSGKDNAAAELEEEESVSSPQDQ